MRIAFDISDLATGRADGTTRYTYELAKRFPTLAPDHAWHYYTPTTPSSRNYQLPSASWRTDYRLHISKWPKYWTQARLPFELFRDQPDVLFMPIQQLPYFRPGKIKTVAVIHDLAVHKYPEQFTYKDWLLLHLFSAYAAREADHLITVSQSTANDVAHYYGRTDNVHVIHHGVDHDHFKPPAEDQRNQSWAQLTHAYRNLTTPYILYVGQIQPRKNIIRLVEAFEQLGQKDPDLKLVIAGSHGWLNQPIFKRISRSPLHDRIVSLGRVPDQLLPALYWHAEVFVLPSLYEGFGMPILEAQAAGCPVVTSNVSSMPEVAGSAAILVDPTSVNSIIEGINQARQNRLQLIEQGRANAKKFSCETAAKQTLDVLLNW